MQNRKNLLDIKTIEDDEEVEYYSEDSDEEQEFQPSKQKNKVRKDFSKDFQFVSSIEEYNQDAWNDLSKYIKKKAKSITDDKIKKARSKIIDDSAKNIQENDSESDISLSDDELKCDTIKTKEKKFKKQSGAENDDFFEDIVTPNENLSFYEMNLSRPLMKAISDLKYTHPTPIQAATIPIALLGRDICGCAATGTGKTAAYMLPTLERLIFRPADNAITRVLVLVPTRELGVQVYQVSKQLAQFTDIQIALAVGGLDLKAQENMLRKNPDIVIATPGRLIDHLKSTPSFSLDSIEVLILDEADRMLDEYFAEQMKEIIRQCSITRQTMLFSATMTDEVNDLVAVSLKKPARIFVDSNQEVAFNLRQEFVRIRKDKDGDREAILAALVCRTFRSGCIIFVQTKKQAHRVHILLGLCGIKVVELHGNLSQTQRLEALGKFKKQEADVLVATDVAARGLDIPGVKTVINFVMPATIEHYIHRVGRTARAGRAGVSVSLAGESERKIVKEIVKKAVNPVKSRIIPNDILEKYQGKLEKMEEQIQEILQEEYEEKLLSKSENQVNRAENILKGEKEEHRPWFQTKKQRMEEKEKLALAGGVKGKGEKDKEKFKKNKKAKKTETSDDRVSNEISKVAMLQARLAKNKSRLKKLNSCIEEGARAGGRKGVKRKSNFTDNLTNTSSKATKMLRYEGKVKSGNNNKFGKNKNKKAGGNKGKAFGKPQKRR